MLPKGGRPRNPIIPCTISHHFGARFEVSPTSARGDSFLDLGFRVDDTVPNNSLLGYGSTGLDFTNTFLGDVLGLWADNVGHNSLKALADEAHSPRSIDLGPLLEGTSAQAPSIGMPLLEDGPHCPGRKYTVLQHLGSNRPSYSELHHYRPVLDIEYNPTLSDT